jgi:hypothetical protein
MVVALDDCPSSVMKAPQNAPESGATAALLSTVMKRPPEIGCAPGAGLKPKRYEPKPPFSVGMRLHATLIQNLMTTG